MINAEDILCSCSRDTIITITTTKLIINVNRFMSQLISIGLADIEIINNNNSEHKLWSMRTALPPADVCILSWRPKNETATCLHWAGWCLLLIFAFGQ